MDMTDKNAPAGIDLDKLEALARNRFNGGLSLSADEALALIALARRAAADAPAADERVLFEAWSVANGNLSPSTDGRYLQNNPDLGYSQRSAGEEWAAWQARAALAHPIGQVSPAIDQAQAAICQPAGAMYQAPAPVVAADERALPSLAILHDGIWYAPHRSAVSPSDATGKAELRVIKFALELAEHENDDAAVSFLKAWNTEDAGYLKANWPDFDAATREAERRITAGEGEVRPLVEVLAALEELSRGAEIAKSDEWVNQRASVLLAALAPRHSLATSATGKADAASAGEVADKIAALKPSTPVVYAPVQGAAYRHGYRDAIGDVAKIAQSPATSVADAMDAEAFRLMVKHQLVPSFRAYSRVGIVGHSDIEEFDPKDDAAALRRAVERAAMSASRNVEDRA
jgi:hypothetical protein